MALVELGILVATITCTEWAIGRAPRWLARMPGLRVETRVIAAARIREDIVSTLTHGGAYRATSRHLPELAVWPRAERFDVPDSAVHDVPCGIVVRPLDAPPYPAFWRSIVHVDATWEGGALVLRARWVPWSLAWYVMVLAALASVAHFSGFPGEMVIASIVGGVTLAVLSFQRHRRDGRALATKSLDAYEVEVTASARARSA
jgi:hypothetical protein